MKTNNIFRNVTMFVAIFVATSANAQVKSAAQLAHEDDQIQRAADAAMAVKGTAGCVRWDDAETKNGYVESLVVDRHSSLTASLGAGAAATLTHADDMGNQTLTSAVFEATLEYKYFKCKPNGKHAKVGLYTGLSAQWNTPVTVENQKTSFTGLLVDAGMVLNPCRKWQVTLAGTLAFLNSVSQSYVDNEVAQGDFNFRSNATYGGGMVKLSYAFGSWKKIKDVNARGQKITDEVHTPIEGFLKVRCMGTGITKPQINGNHFTWSGFRGLVELGFTVGF